MMYLSFLKGGMRMNKKILFKLPSKAKFRPDVCLNSPNRSCKAIRT